MARVEGFEPEKSGQEPVDVNGNPVPVGVWGDSTTGVGVFGTSGVPPPDVDNIPTNIAGVEGHSIQNPGVFGHSLQGNGVSGESLQGFGVLGRSATGNGVQGVTFTPSIPNQPPDASGVFGSSTTGGDGVVGFVGDATGVVGNSVRGTGVRGLSGTGVGVLGESADEAGVSGRSNTAIGVLGESLSANKAGVSGRNNTGTGVEGLGDIGVLGSSGTRFGVVGVSSGGGSGEVGVLGSSGTGTGVLGECFADRQAGVLGRSRSRTGTGVVGESAGVAGVLGRSIGVGEGEGVAAGVSGVQFSVEPGFGVDGTSVLGDGVHGLSFGNFGVVGEGRNGGVQGITRSTDPNAAGVLGQSVDGFAGVFLGKVRITGSLSKGGGGFEIDHPLDPANRYLCHSFVESPDMLNVYNGNVTTDTNGEASVTLPDYFEALNRDFRYQLTVLGQFAQAIVAQEISNNRFTIKTDQPQVKVSWQVTGIRQDPWATTNRMVVEEEKAAEERGRYLHPELYGQPVEARIHRNPQQRESELRRISEDRVRQVSELVPEHLRQRVEQHLQALRRGDHVDREELQGLLVEARRLSEPPLLEEPQRIDLLGEPPRIDRARLEEEWRQVEELIQRMR